MNASPAPAASPRSREPTDEPAAEETLAAHARRALRTRVRTRVTAVLDTGIAFLQRLRKKAGGEQEKAEDTDDRRGSRPDRSEARRGASAAPVETPAEAPKPKRRLRALLIYVGVLLVGGIGGGALAYTLYQQQLDRVLNDSLRQEAARSKKTRPSAEIQKAFDNEQTQRADAEKTLAASLAAYSASTSGAYTRLESLFGEQLAENRRLEAALADTSRSSAETQKTLAEELARRTEAEGKLADSAKSMADKQRQLDAAEKQLASLHVADGSRSVQREVPDSSPGDSRRSRPLKSGNCTLDTKNVDALKGCIESFNR
ncbi:MAG: hypothetical protein HY018_03585 [Hydrogenophilales bacterium]|nr:hypothetical protein [Hydrogenophilales bacterium]